MPRTKRCVSVLRLPSRLVETSHGGQFLICHGCGLVAELDDGTIARRVRSRAQSLGFTVQRQTIEIMGLCPECGAEAAGDAG